MTGTGFAFRLNDLLVTCDHVLVGIAHYKDKVTGDTLEELVDINAARDVEITAECVVAKRSYKAEVIARDRARDLAILKLKGLSGGERHFSVTAFPVAHARALVIGHPNQSPGRPPTSMNTVILSVFPFGGLQRFDVKDTIRMGNSGGPVVSPSFKLTGVAQEGATQSHGNNQCISVDELVTWMNSLALEEAFPKFEKPAAMAVTASKADKTRPPVVGLSLDFPDDALDA